MFTLYPIGVLFYFVYTVYGHGRLMDPPSRSSAWRAGFNTPENYDDTALYCGGPNRQQSLGGKCGVCGDPWDGARENEAGGRYATGIIVRNFTVGQVIHARVDVTVNHLGWMEFRLCPNNNVHKPITHDCLNRYLLTFSGGSGTRYHVTTGRTGYYNFYLKLPDGLTCSQCVLQWKYHAGNIWGTDPVTGRGCVGCGPQEEFYGCADIQIRSKGLVQPVGHISTKKQTISTTTRRHLTTSTTTHITRKTSTPTPIKQETSTPRTITNNPDNPGQFQCRAMNIWAGIAGMDGWCTRQCSKGNCLSASCACNNYDAAPGARPFTKMTTTTTTSPTMTAKTTPTTTTTTPTKRRAPPITTASLSSNSGRMVCKGINYWAGSSYLDKWCTDYCARGNCPETSCKCTRQTVTTQTTSTTAAPIAQPIIVTQRVCKAISFWKGNDIFDQWCAAECNRGNCPAATCQCVETPLQPLCIQTTAKPTTTTTTTTTTAPPSAHAQCVSKGIYSSPRWTKYCQQQCDNGYCAISVCSCY